MRAVELSPRTYHRVTVVAVVLLAIIIVSGAAVRLTGSGLGCPDWPTCERGRVVAPLEYHAMVEFVNRTVTGLVSVVIAVAVLGSHRRRPYRRDLFLLSLGLVAGVVGQIVLGGLVVRFDLYPPLVMSHLYVSLALLSCAVVLSRRAGEPHARPAQAVVPRAVVLLGRALVVGLTAVTVLGTIVTGSGPHPGSSGDQLVDRLPFALHDVARLHGAAVMAFVALVVVTVVALLRTGAPGAVLRRAEVLLGVVVAQAAVGYVQYFTGVPALLVTVHVAGVTAVWVATLRMHLGLFSRDPSGAAAPTIEKVLAPT